MRKSILAAAALAALAFGTTGSASAGVVGGSLGGLNASAPAELTQQVHWRPYQHRRHHWKKHRKTRHCVWRHGHRRCWWR